MHVRIKLIIISHGVISALQPQKQLQGRDGKKKTKNAWMWMSGFGSVWSVFSDEGCTKVSY